MISVDPTRSPRWKHARALFLRDHPACVACAAPSPSVNVHHVIPFDVVLHAGRPDLELDPRNLLTLCEAGARHHLVLGHLADWDSYNPSVRADAARVDAHGQPGRAIATLPWWLAAHANRPRPYARLSLAERAALRAHLDAIYPLDLRVISPSSKNRHALSSVSRSDQ